MYGWVETSVLILTSAFVGLMSWFIANFRASKSSFVYAENSFSILIAFHGEWIALERLLGSLKQIFYSKKGSIHIADDHSRPNLNEHQELLVQSKFVNWIKPPLSINGKKAVQRYAVDGLSSEWILLLDVDTQAPEFLQNGYLPETVSYAEMVLIPVQPITRRGFWNAFFDLDFLSLQAATVASAQSGEPLLANGACLLIKRQAYQAVAADRDDWSYPHGDDMFLMHAVAKKFGKPAIAVLHPSQGYAQSAFPDSFWGLYRQRLRWIGKVDRLPNVAFQCAAWVILLAQFMLLFNILASLLGLVSLRVAFIASSVCVGSSGFLLLRSCRAFNRRDLMWYIPPALMLYPVYLISLALVQLSYKAFRR